MSYDGAHLVKLSPTVEVSHFSEYEGRPEFAGLDLFMLGLDGGAPITTDVARGHHLSLDLPAERLRVIDRLSRIVQEIEFHDLSGDWGYATYSADGKWLAIGVPYDLFLYRWSDRGH